jgi:hypothetical protein
MPPKPPEQAVTALVFTGAWISELLDADIDDRARTAAPRRRVNGRFPYTETTGNRAKKQPAGRSPFAGIARIRCLGRRSAAELSPGLSAFPPGSGARSVQLPRSPRR